ncbi:MAG TPA: hypothetical protein VMU04_11750 [Candidatus Acidoferrum sp.]|nr:hypothetical protein [Candidatus Acidoferrum sp.]
MAWIALLRPLAGLVAGVVIGVGFGLCQSLALRRNQRLQQAGELRSGWAVMPGSMRRVGYLLIALVAVQLLCPLLFRDGVQWWVSGGVVVGYGAMLFCQLRLRP